MRIVDVKPAGYRALIEHDVDDLVKIRTALDCMERNVASLDDDKKVAVNYLVEVFYPRIDKLLKDLNYGT